MIYIYQHIWTRLKGRVNFPDHIYNRQTSYVQTSWFCTKYMISFCANYAIITRPIIISWIRGLVKVMKFHCLFRKTWNVIWNDLIRLIMRSYATCISIVNLNRNASQYNCTDIVLYRRCSSAIGPSGHTECTAYPPIDGEPRLKLLTPSATTRTSVSLQIDLVNCVWTRHLVFICVVAT